MKNLKKDIQDNKRIEDTIKFQIYFFIKFGFLSLNHELL